MSQNTCCLKKKLLVQEMETHPTHNVGGKTQLHGLTKGHVDDIVVVDLKDAYPRVMQDLQALKAGGRIWLISIFGEKYMPYAPTEITTASSPLDLQAICETHLMEYVRRIAQRGYNIVYS
ncbi:transcription initiation factor IIE subunit beta [Artemisia annua]|uniref:Transcription initiation factor IIE subunit beta n=1 Tax=Artemisia annua TaxID=35608 RepID=A0A2U1P2I6_ARTAN|nr:transcription initiation factor IIE subunit beta [Artemisia annua]